MRRRTTLRTSHRATDLDLPVDLVWQVAASGDHGPRWYVDAAPFVLRGAVDRLVGGSGRRWEQPGTPLLAVGDRAGFWSVLGADHDGSRRRLVLQAEVRAPGTVRLTTEARSLSPSRTRLVQTISFAPRGALGAAYLLADVPAREAVIELAHRRLLADLLADLPT